MLELQSCLSYMYVDIRTQKYTPSVFLPSVQMNLNSYRVKKYLIRNFSHVILSIPIIFCLF